MKHPELVARLATSNISTKDFSYLTTVLMEIKTCENCKYYGAEHEHIAHPNYRTCINVDSFTYMTEPHFTDGCNKWEKNND